MRAGTCPRMVPTHVLARHVRATARAGAAPARLVPPLFTTFANGPGVARNPPMATATANTMTLDIPLLECGPPPIPRAAIRSKSRQRTAVLGPGNRIGAWRIDRELGRGGMATVYATSHIRFGKRAAVKLAHSAVLGPRFTPETFLREARMANLINHPGVVEVFATGTFGGRPYLAMEQLAGSSLGARLEAGPLGRDEALEILVELCDVLSAAHAAGVTHRDIKLDNVFLLESPGAGGRRTKLLDWGMARIAGEDDPLRGLIAGTLSYVAPEQMRGEDITPAADIYALGVLAYRLLLGAVPFSSPSELDLLDQHLNARPPEPRMHWRSIPPALEAMLLAMLAKRPEDRPSLAEIASTFRTSRARIRRPRITTPSWIVSAPVVHDVIGRPALPYLSTTRQRVAGAALGLAITAASLLQLLLA
jgi:serine/threonine protein kinase